MQPGLVDGAALLEVVASLDLGGPRQSSHWAWTTAIDVTLALISNPNLWLSPIPVHLTAPAGEYGNLLNSLSIAEDRKKDSEKVRNTALTRTRAWGSRYPLKLHDIFTSMKENPSYPSWIDWLKHNQWPEHAARHGGLIDSVFVGQISKALSLDQKEIESIINISKLDIISISKSDSVDDKTLLLQDAFTLSTILRGIMYDNISKLNNYSIFHHPIRKFSPRKPTHALFEVTGSEWYLSIILLSCVLNTPKKHRIEKWAQSVLSARSMYPDLYLGQARSDEEAIKRAVAASQLIGFDTNPKWIDSLINDGISAGVGVLTSFFVGPFTGFGAGLAYSLLSSRLNVGRFGARLFSARHSRLAKMVESDPGRIHSNWIQSK